MITLLKNCLYAMLVVGLTLSPGYEDPRGIAVDLNPMIIMDKEIPMAASPIGGMASAPIQFGSPEGADGIGQGQPNQHDDMLSYPTPTEDPSDDFPIPVPSPELAPTAEEGVGEAGADQSDPDAESENPIGDGGAEDEHQSGDGAAEEGQQSGEQPLMGGQLLTGDQPEETYAPSNFDMAQFIPNGDFGLFGMNDEGELVSLEGTTLTLGDEFSLAVNFQIDHEVVANTTYTYWLPEVLTGKSGAPAETFSSSDGEIAACFVSGNQLTMVFTEWAAEATKDGANTFLLSYKFIAELDPAVVGSYTQFQVMMPTAYGRQAIQFNIDGHAVVDQSAQEAEAGPTPRPEAEQQPEGAIPGEEEPSDAPESPADESGSTGDQPEEDEGLSPEADGGLLPEGSVTINRIMPESGIIFAGDTFVVEATVVGFDDVSYQTQWQYDAGDGWMDMEGDGLQLTVTVNDDLSNLNYAWRVVLTIDEGAHTA